MGSLAETFEQCSRQRTTRDEHPVRLPLSVVGRCSSVTLARAFRAETEAIVA